MGQFDNKIKIKGLGGILMIGDKPGPEIEYLLSIKVELEGIIKDLKEKDNPQYTYLMRYLSTEQIMEIRSKKKIEVQNGKTDSQKLRWAIETEANQIGVDEKDYYHKEMQKLIAERMARIKE